MELQRDIDKYIVGAIQLLTLNRVQALKLIHVAIIKAAECVPIEELMDEAEKQLVGIKKFLDHIREQSE